MNLLGAASALNAAAAVAAVAAALRRALSRAQLTVIAAALETVKPVPGRLATRQVNDLVVIDDTYNANPRSVRAALEAARETADGLKARLLVALGDMLELGSTLRRDACRSALRSVANQPGYHRVGWSPNSQPRLTPSRRFPIPVTTPIASLSPPIVPPPPTPSAASSNPATSCWSKAHAASRWKKLSMASNERPLPPELRLSYDAFNASVSNHGNTSLSLIE